MVWVRTDGRRISDDPALLQQGNADVTAIATPISILEHRQRRHVSAWLQKEYV